MAKMDSEVRASVILSSEESGELLGRVLDQAVVALHADMQGGKVAPSDFEKSLADMQDTRDDVVSRADSGQELPNGDRLRYFTPASIGLLRTAFAAAIARPEQAGLPADRLRSLNERFERAAEALAVRPRRSRSRSEGMAYSRWLPALVGALWSVAMYGSQGAGTVAGMLVVMVPLAYLAAYAADRRQYTTGQRMAALWLWPFYLIYFIPFMFVVGLLRTRPSAGQARVLGTSAPRTTTTVVRTRGASVVVVNRAADQQQFQPQPFARTGTLDD